MKPNFLKDLGVGFRFAVTQPTHTTVFHVSSLIEITIDGICIPSEIKYPKDLVLLNKGRETPQ